MLFLCSVCHIQTPNRADYKKHIQTKKHYNNVLKAGGSVSPGSDGSISTENEIILNIDDISNNRGNDTFSNQKTKPTYSKDQQCKYCGLGYSYSSGLYRHMKHCTGRTQEIESNANGSSMNTIISKLLNENKEFKQMLMDVMKTNTEIIRTNRDLITSQQDTTNKVLELYKTNTSTVTNNIYNHKGDNNTFNISVFLNEKCKDAMNMTDFAKSIEVTMENMDDIRERGYVENISTIFINNLKNTEINKRPIHCSDRKREVLYVKDDDRWEREDVNSQKLKDAVKIVEHKHAGLVNKWADEHPGCEKSSNKQNNQYLKMCRNIGDGDDDKILRVVKKIAKETVIDKDVLLL